MVYLFITISYIYCSPPTGRERSKGMYRGREPGGLDPLGQDDKLIRLRSYDNALRRRTLFSPTIAFLMSLLFIVFGVWTLLSGVAYLGYALFFLGVGAFFALVTGLMLWRDARRRRTNLGQ